MSSPLFRRVAAHLEHARAVADLAAAPDADLLARFRATADPAAVEARPKPVETKVLGTLKAHPPGE